ncbi:YggS family pyridoxal phosphate-dependent enzyme [Pseudohongiella spirulinae]|nr:YggS family pyridoxal phosphate-dependent enzyme [Pseudohongiella spirulinae]
MSDTIKNRYQQLLDELARQESIAGRLPGSVHLLAVSKTHGPEKIREAWQAGARQFGENYVQEALDKISVLSEPGTDTPDIVWHFIGPIQSNKTRDIAEHFDWVHSVDRLKIARRLNEQRPADMPPLNICVQVNLSHEDSKSGVDINDVDALCQQIAEQMPRLKIRGLMAIPAPSTEYEIQRQTFHPLKVLFDKLRVRYPDMDTLSMGMSDDYPAAIAEGATMIRIGTAIFGHRERPA